MNTLWCWLVGGEDESRSAAIKRLLTQECREDRLRWLARESDGREVISIWQRFSCRAEAKRRKRG